MSSKFPQSESESSYAPRPRPLLCRPTFGLADLSEEAAPATTSSAPFSSSINFVVGALTAEVFLILAALLIAPMSRSFLLRFLVDQAVCCNEPPVTSDSFSVAIADALLSAAFCCSLNARSSSAVSLSIADAFSRCFSETESRKVSSSSSSARNWCFSFICSSTFSSFAFLLSCKTSYKLLPPSCLPSCLGLFRSASICAWAFAQASSRAGSLADGASTPPAATKRDIGPLSEDIQRLSIIARKTVCRARLCVPAFSESPTGGLPGNVSRTGTSEGGHAFSTSDLTPDIPLCSDNYS